jgi:hypothetical protein
MAAIAVVAGPLRVADNVGRLFAGETLHDCVNSSE